MTNTKTKYLSYFGNLNHQAKIEELHGAHGAIINVIIAFVLVITVASGMRIIENRITNPNSFHPFEAKVAMAAELTNKAEIVDYNPNATNIKPSSALTITLKYKNIGTSTWTKKSVYLKSSTTALKFKHKFWPDPYLPAQLTEATVDPGEIGTFKFALQAPDNFNYYSGEFMLVNNNVLVSGSETTISLNVVSDPAKHECL